MKKREKILSIRKMTIIGILGSISIVLGMTPLGFIPVGPTRATIMHIPVIIGAIMEGPLVGGMIGLIFGLFSIFQAVTRPTPVSFVFLNPVISVVPRILVGIFTYYSYRVLQELRQERTFWFLNLLLGAIIIYLGYGTYMSLKVSGDILSLLINGVLIILTLLIAIYGQRKLKDKTIDVILATVVGTLTNTIGVLGTVYLLYGEKFVIELGQDPSMARKVIMGVGIANGIPEVIIAVIIVGNVVAVLRARRS